MAAAGARDVALSVLTRVERDQAFAAAALSSALERTAGLLDRDRALATELTYGVLRWRGALDHALDACAPRGIGRLDIEVLTALRIAAYQICRLDRVPRAAAVSAAVEQVRRLRGERMGGFVNAILRALGRDEHEAQRKASDLRASHPQWLLSVFRERVGDGADLDELLAVNNRPAPLALRVQRRRMDAPGLAQRLEGEHPGVRVQPGRHLPTCIRVEGMRDPQASAAFRQGLFTVQDEGAQLAAETLSSALLDSATGFERRGVKHLRVLDACAGRGGKTGALAEALGEGWAIDAADRFPEKLQILHEEMARLQTGWVRTHAVDLEIGLGSLTPGYLGIMLDAPCSGSGVVRRRPDIRWRNVPDLARLAQTQRRLLQTATSLLAAGGLLVYCVCSLASEEGPAVIRSGSLKIISERFLLPHRDDTDGFFVSLLKQ